MCVWWCVRVFGRGGIQLNMVTGNVCVFQRTSESSRSAGTQWGSHMTRCVCVCVCKGLYLCRARAGESCGGGKVVGERQREERGGD